MSGRLDFLAEKWVDGRRNGQLINFQWIGGVGRVSGEPAGL